MRSQTPYDDMLYVPGLREIALERIRIEAQARIDRAEWDVCNRAQREVLVDAAHRHLTAALRLAVYGKRHPSKTVASFPANWFEAVKERFAPAWVLKRWPVKRTEITVSLTETYPEYSRAWDDSDPVLRLVLRMGPVAIFDDTFRYGS